LTSGMLTPQGLVRLSDESGPKRSGGIAVRRFPPCAYSLRAFLPRIPVAHWRLWLA
jgi:hypothetical protein